MKSFKVKADILIETGTDISNEFFTQPNVFETIFIYKSSPIFLKEHLQRLNQGLIKMVKELAVAILPDEVALTKLIRDLLLRNRGCSYLRITAMTSGGLYFSVSEEIFYPSHDYVEGISVKGIEKKIVINEQVMGIKGSHLKKNVDLRAKIKQEGYDEGLLVNHKGFISEGCVSNVFWINNGTIFTPSTENCLLPGIVRQKTIEIAKKQKLGIFEGDYVLEKIKEADEVFLTNSLMGIMPVREIIFNSTDIKTICDRRITSFLMEEYKYKLEEEVNAFL